MILYENGYRLFSMGYRHESYKSYRIVQVIVQKCKVYDLYDSPIGRIVQTIVQAAADKKEEEGNG